MASFPVDAERNWERVRRYLTGAMPECEVTSESLVSDQTPMIFMWTAHLMAGFAFSNGDTGASYQQLYGGFKDYYTENRKRLDALELSFVFCVRPDLPDVESFSSAVETDAYFCRKFVVRLAESLDRSFERLPFLPLALGTGRLQRPPSAQTYMRQCEVPATLAKYLAVPHQRGAENIVKDCVDESSTWTPILAGSSRARMSVTGDQNEEDESVRLDAVAIQNFRAYKRKQVFELGSAVTMLYGPNGFGKTSFFDAVDFAATGGVGRLGLSASTDRFAKAMGHLDGKPEDAVVGLRFSATGATRKITRYVASRANALIDGSTYDRKKALVEITGGGLEATDRVEHLVSLFRATHLFGQGRPELARGFDRDCALPPQVLAHMLAFDDYANARSKASEVCDVLNRWLDEANKNVEVLRKQVEEAELAIGNLERASTEFEHSASPTEALAELRRRIQEVGLSVATEGTERVFVRACRAALQAGLADGEARIRRLTSLVEEVRALPSVGKGLAELAKRRSRAENDLRSAEEALGQAAAAQGEATALLQELQARRAAARARVDALRWVQQTQPRYRELLRVEGERTEALRTASGALEQLRERRIVTAGDLRAKEQEAKKIRPRLARGRDVVARLRKLVDAAETWRSDLVVVQQATPREEALGKQLANLRREEEELASRLRQSRAARERLDEQLVAIEREQSDFAQLLGRVEEHLRDALCPLCGHDHGSLEVLVEHVEKQRARDAAAGLRRELGVLKEAGEEFEKRLAEVRRTATAQGKQADALREQRQAADARIAGFEEALAKVVTTVQEPSTTIKDINERLAREKDSTDEMERLEGTLHVGVESARATLAELDREIQDAEKNVSETERELNDCRSQAERLRTDDRTAEASLDAEATVLLTVEALRMEELTKADVAVSTASGPAKERTADVSGLRQRVSALATTLDGLKRKIGARRRTTTETTARLAEFDLAAGVEHGEVANRLEKETKTNSRLAELLDFADSVEVAMDTAMTAAALRQQRQAIRERERKIEETKQKIERYESWRDYFAELNVKLAAKQNAAVASFADEYGPTASAIQERLRSVYGFDGIDTRSHETTIRVRVRRGKDVLRPTDYFSDSQQRTLLLGLFLTASISQSWSSLSTVLLDDPIMHFDDLNTYAFLDMVAGFLDARSGPRQFIMSTCDRKVMQLARKRFRHLGRDARFYEFAAIGRDGPIVQEITAG